MIELAEPVLYYVFFIGLAVAFVVGGMAASAWLRPRARADLGAAAYESGEAPEGSPWVPFRARYYVIALTFLLFEVELALLFPWSQYAYTTSRAPAGVLGWRELALAEALVFILLLALGLAFVWARGLLAWPRPASTERPWQSPIPADAYQKAGLLQGKP